MTSLLPIISDIIPMVMPAAVQVTKSTDLDAGTGQTEGMIRKGAIINKSEKICASGPFSFLYYYFSAAGSVTFYPFLLLLSS
jgi:hypothetical protein